MCRYGQYASHTCTVSYLYFTVALFRIDSNLIFNTFRDSLAHLSEISSTREANTNTHHHSRLQWTPQDTAETFFHRLRHLANKRPTIGRFGSTLLRCSEWIGHPNTQEAFRIVIHYPPVHDHYRKRALMQV